MGSHLHLRPSPSLEGRAGTEIPKLPIMVGLSGDQPSSRFHPGATQSHLIRTKDTAVTQEITSILGVLSQGPGAEINKCVLYYLTSSNTIMRQTTKFFKWAKDLSRNFTEVQMADKYTRKLSTAPGSREKGARPSMKCLLLRRPTLNEQKGGQRRSNWTISCHWREHRWHHHHKGLLGGFLQS